MTSRLYSLYHVKGERQKQRASEEAPCAWLSPPIPNRIASNATGVNREKPMAE